MTEKDKIIENYQISQQLYWQDKEKLNPNNFILLMSVANLITQTAKEQLKNEGLSSQEARKEIGLATKKVGDQRREQGDSGLITSTQSI